MILELSAWRVDTFGWYIFLKFWLPIVLLTYLGNLYVFIFPLSWRDAFCC